MGRLLAFEWQVLRRERGLWILLIIIAAIGGYASVTGGAFVNDRAARIEELRGSEARRLDSIRGLVAQFEAGDTTLRSRTAGPRNPASAGRSAAARHTLLPPGPLASLAVGQADVQPFWALVTTQTKQNLFVNDEIDNPIHLLAGRLDIGFLVLVLYPLFILALTFDVVSGERERGTLILLLSQPAEPQRVLTAKIGLRALVALGLTVGLSVAAALATGVPLSDPAALGRLALWIAILVLYGAFWFAAALFVNSRRIGSAASAVALLAIWLGVVVVLPAIATAAIVVSNPAPSRVVLTAKLREATDAAATRRTSALATFLLDHPGSASDSTIGTDPFVMATALQLEAERLMAPEYERFDAALDAQRQAAGRFRFLSPALITQAAMLDAAGSGEARFREYERQFDAFHAAWRAYFNERMIARQTLHARDYETLPSFTFREESLGSVAARAAPGLLLMAVSSLALIAGARRGLREAARTN